MAHEQIHNMTGLDHLATGGSATTLLGINSSGVIHQYYSLIGSNNTIVSRAGTAYFVSSATGTGIVYASSDNQYVVMSVAADLTHEFRLVQSGNSITVTTNANTITINAVTNATVGTTKTIRLPMSLLSVEVNSGNAYWVAQSDGTRMDRAYINMSDSGRSVSTWWIDVPSNLNSVPAWNLEIVSEAATVYSTGGFLVLNVDGMSVAAGESANTLASGTTQLVSAGSFALNNPGILTISTMSATNFDGTLATSGTEYMKIKIARQGSSDTFNSDWYIYSVRFKATVDV